MARSAQDLKQDWLAALAHERRFSANTLRAYGDDLSRLLGFLHDHLGGAVDARALAKLSPADFRAFITLRRSEGLSSRSVQRTLASIRSFFRWLAREEILENPAPRAIRGPRVKRGLPRPLSEKDAKSFLDKTAQQKNKNYKWLPARDAALFTLLYGAGLRISEALSLKRGDAPLSESLSIIGKGNKERSVPVLPAVRKAIDDYLKACPLNLGPHAPLFLSRLGKAMSPREAQSVMQALRSQLGLSERATPHALRHSFATHLLANGGDLRSVQELLGHASLSTTQTYTEIETSQLMEIYKKAHPRAKAKPKPKAA
ncbi:MAG TPA: tyrosine recombinase XerC [Rhizomicrobium sp.]|jgi:integrase/recombinase XerC|nr:tyrosine recombinase XerC [Rhizomicrobium sp.]